MSDVLKDVIKSPWFEWRLHMLAVDRFDEAMVLDEMQANLLNAHRSTASAGLADHDANVGPLLSMLRKALGDDADEMTIQLRGDKWWVQCWPEREHDDERGPVEDAHWSLVCVLAHALLALPGKP